VPPPRLNPSTRIEPTRPTLTGDVVLELEITMH
jgi:hypothetical protein